MRLYPFLLLISDFRSAFYRSQAVFRVPTRVCQAQKAPRRRALPIFCRPFRHVAAFPRQNTKCCLFRHPRTLCGRDGANLQGKYRIFRLLKKTVPRPRKARFLYIRRKSVCPTAPLYQYCLPPPAQSTRFSEFQAAPYTEPPRQVKG